MRASYADIEAHALQSYRPSPAPRRQFSAAPLTDCIRGPTAKIASQMMDATRLNDVIRQTTGPSGQSQLNNLLAWEDHLSRVGRYDLGVPDERVLLAGVNRIR